MGGNSGHVGTFCQVGEWNTVMKVVRKLNLDYYPELKSKPLARLMGILNSDGTNARMVGGCVRDALLGRKIIDVDIACCLLPEQSMERLECEGVKVIPTGLKYGTITAVVKGQHFEITTLRRDVESDGRHAKVAFTDDWIEDAVRRDFTINALYLDEDGSLYDPCDGLSDLYAKHICFIGDATERITEDALRILRFFRFAAQIGGSALDKDGLAACAKNKNLISHLSGERLAQELFKILSADNVVSILRIMDKFGITPEILPDYMNCEKACNYIQFEGKVKRCNLLARLSCLSNGKAGDISRHLKLSNQQLKAIRRYQEHNIIVHDSLNKQEARKYIYLWGRDVFIFALLDYGLTGELIDYAVNWEKPTFPVLGRDLIKVGITAGPQLGQMLKKLENEWLESDFSQSRDNLLQKACAIN